MFWSETIRDAMFVGRSDSGSTFDVDGIRVTITDADLLGWRSSEGGLLWRREKSPLAPGTRYHLDVVALPIIRSLRTAEGRYAHRRALFAQKYRVLPMVRHHAWWLLHNCVAHPFLAVRASTATVWFHDWTSMHLNLRDQVIASPIPDIPAGRMGAWIYHNLVYHVAIGLWPSRDTFDFHDRSANELGVANWV